MLSTGSVRCKSQRLCGFLKKKPRSWPSSWSYSPRSDAPPVATTASRRRTYHEISFAESGEPEDALEYRRCSPHRQRQDGGPDTTTAGGDEGVRGGDGSSAGSGVRDVRCDPELIKQLSGPGPSPPLARVEMVSAPWNPADWNTVQGRYPNPYSSEQPGDDGDGVTDYSHVRGSQYFPGRAVAGSEGWGRVTAVHRVVDDVEGDDKSDLVGRWVTVGQPGVGTMRSDMWVPSRTLVPVRRGDELYRAAGHGASALFQLGGTAIRMLRDFAVLREGDVVVQNAGNSGVGFVLSQIATSSSFPPDVSVVSVVRRGSRTPRQYDEMVEYLTERGRNSLVVAEEDLAGDPTAVKNLQSEIRRISSSAGDGRPPKLALNAVGGESSSVLLRLLGPGGIHVTYGGMSMKPVTVATPQLIFKDVSVAGYWHSAWMIRHPMRDRFDMIQELVDLVLSGEIVCPPAEVFPLSDFRRALARQRAQSNAPIRSKIVFDTSR